MACLTPVGSSDTASYAAYGRIAALGGNPYVTNPLAALARTRRLHLAVGVGLEDASRRLRPVRHR